MDFFSLCDVFRRHEVEKLEVDIGLRIQLNPHHYFTYFAVAKHWAIDNLGLSQRKKRGKEYGEYDSKKLHDKGVCKSEIRRGC
jgi:hypothetical protein